MSKVKRAHMVSRGYLKPWSDGQNRVEVIDIDKRKGFTTAIGNATVVNYAYESGILRNDLEGEFQKVESAGIPNLVKLRAGHALDKEEKRKTVDFLDMHLSRGRFANQVEVLTPALVLRADKDPETLLLKLGDRFLLSQYEKETLRLPELQLEDWPWVITETRGLITGDGAVLLWHREKGGPVATVSFPLSPTQLLVIGEPLAISGTQYLNDRVGVCSRRWLVGSIGSLNLEWAK
ncbi:DUF4238 domain-containing protein [Glutamicibacter mishrai]|uniref:DUF4238 domain-containing protein n=1 Tax=Glutamicibacter mishrai TaxID=1775880 RepID=A0A6H0SJT4_9MICC|nr:DUF4238 domain-containing protein [Glutamicibacter mishrai]QIV87733.1 DUF4238 domain-containing protein [Glutamicibacter mishrai]